MYTLLYINYPSRGICKILRVSVNGIWRRLLQAANSRKFITFCYKEVSTAKAVGSRMEFIC